MKTVSAGRQDDDMEEREKKDHHHLAHMQFLQNINRSLWFFCHHASILPSLDVDTTIFY